MEGIRVPVDQFENQGFKNAPVSKICISVTMFATLSAHFLIDPYFLTFDYDDIFAKFKVLRLFVSLHCFTRLHQAIFSALLIYKFRQIERRCGSRQFLVFLCCHAAMTIISILILLRIDPLRKLDFGPIPVLFGFFIPYFSIPAIEISRIRFLSSKTVTYLVAVQMALYSENTLIAAFLGLVIGLATKYNVMWCQKWFSFVRNVKLASDNQLLIDYTNFPATVEAQQVQMMEQFQRQMFVQQAHRPVQPDQQAITRLVEMGFSREMASDALRQHSNDVQQSILSLLTQSGRAR